MVREQNVLATQSGLSWLKGALAGFFATAPMTVFMLTTQRFLPKGQQYELPPELIIKELAHRAHVRWHMSKTQILAATLVSHFGYGAAMGALYSPLDKKVPLTPVVKGIIFGFAVWVGSYLGLLPLMGISESAHREPVRRNMMMVAAHLVWGSVMGLVTGLRTYP